MISAISQSSGYTGGIDLATVLKNRREEMFSQMDTDGNGVIDTVELQSFSQQMADKVNGPSADEMMATMDTDGDGQISKAEFDTAMTEMEAQMASQTAGSPPPPPPEEVSFSDLDTNGDGYVSLEELQAAAPQDSDGTQGPSADEILARMDTDGDGQISKAEFDTAETERESRMAPMGSGPASAEEMFSSMDTDGDGQISKAEFETAFASMESRTIATMSEQTQSDGETSGVQNAAGNGSTISRMLETYLGGYQSDTDPVLNLLG